MAKITANIDIEVDDKIADKVVDILAKGTERELPEGIELELRDIGGKLVVKVVQSKGP